MITSDGRIEDGRSNWVVNDVNDESPLDTWNVEKSGYDVVSLNVDRDTNSSSRDLFEITYPYLSGIRIVDLAKILDDENDHISKARAGLKAVLREGKTHGRQIPEITQDILRPEIDKLHRKYKSIASRFAIRQSTATVGVMSLALVSSLTSGLPQMIAAMLGTGGMGLLAKETSDRMQEMSVLSDNPYYLMWRLRKKLE